MEIIGIKATGYCSMQTTIEYLNAAVDRMAFNPVRAMLMIEERQALINAREAKNK